MLGLQSQKLKRYNHLKQMKPPLVPQQTSEINTISSPWCKTGFMTSFRELQIVRTFAAPTNPRPITTASVPRKVKTQRLIHLSAYPGNITCDNENNNAREMWVHYREQCSSVQNRYHNKKYYPVNSNINIYNYNLIANIWYNPKPAFPTPNTIG